MCAGAGGYADYAVCDWGRVVTIPEDMSFEDAATLPVALGTMHDALVTNGRLEPGESVLIQGASSAVGLMALQIAKLLGAKFMIGTSTNPDRRARLKEFGADRSIDTTDPNWPDIVLKATDGAGVNLIIDQVSGSLINGNMRAAVILGRIVNVGRLGAGKAEFDFDLHANRRITYIGVTHRTRSVDELREETRAMWVALADAVRTKKLRLPIDKIFPLEQAKAAQEYMRANRHSERYCWCLNSVFLTPLRQACSDARLGRRLQGRNRLSLHHLRQQIDSGRQSRFWQSKIWARRCHVHARWQDLTTAIE